MQRFSTFVVPSQITRTTVEYMLGILTRLQPLDEDTEVEVLQRMLSTLTHENMCAEYSVNASVTSTISRRTTNTGEMGSTKVLLTQFNK